MVAAYFPCCRRPFAATRPRACDCDEMWRHLPYPNRKDGPMRRASTTTILVQVASTATQGHAQSLLDALGEPAVACVFLDANGVPYEVLSDPTERTIEDIGEEARRFAGLITCHS
jgi:hypothetical protein